MIKVFRMNDCDWVAAETAEQAMEWYLKETGVSKGEATDGEPAVELTAAEMLTLKFVDREEADPPVERTFEEELAERVALPGAAFPQLFASTEY